MSEIICQTVNLSKKYKDTVILEKVNINIKKGEIYGLIGENGAGKTTLIKIIAQLIKPTEGNVKLFGETSENELCRLQKKIGYTIETPALYMDMTARQNLEVIRIEKGIPGTSDIDKVLSMVNLNDTDKKKVKNFSLGMKQRLALAVALLNDPEILILDEPLNGLDPTGISELRNLLKKLNTEKNITIILSSHILSELYKLATCYGIMHKGKIVEEISAEILDNRCKKHIFIKVSDIKIASMILEKDLGINDFIVCDDDIIKIYSNFDKCSQINKALVLNSILVEEISIKGECLESYFKNIIGGKLYV
ncbi:ABC transporter ATP-binding protein [[Clostridium] sordellii]|uniref:ABC transporter ATP-binding protein n=1 Tax=Paraclostridium sordellii TaxID=1505 RepID=UPI00054456B8|nr:ABC transporter ATP-binding protein [Paeniclostridium sordellii]CEK30062.1 ABC transporter ATP-binding protein [[Clostridium] sordellii] [Paeniclostridium sordellii]